MTWTSPRTWVNGETIPEGTLNTHVRDNLASLKGDAGSFTPQGSTAGTWTTSSASGLYQRTGNVVTVHGGMIRSSGGTSGVPLTVYWNGCPEFSVSMSGYIIGQGHIGGVTNFQLIANTGAIGGGATAYVNGSSYNMTVAGSDVVRFQLTYPCASL